jgi:hypothetical protein
VVVVTIFINRNKEKKNNFFKIKKKIYYRVRIKNKWKVVEKYLRKKKRKIGMRIIWRNFYIKNKKKI